MSLPVNKTKIVCTIGPACESPEILEQMIRTGMNVARLNFSHGDFEDHKERILKIRAASKATGRRVAIMADLPGPKMRIGTLEPEPLELKASDHFTLTVDEIVGNDTAASVSFKRLPMAVKPGDTLFLNDGLIQLEVLRVEGGDVHCRIVVGGELWSRKGLNLPGIDLGISAFTERDHDCLRFALENGVDAISQSFVEHAADVTAVREACVALGHSPFIIAKIERSRALDNFDGILQAADGIMIARGDLGVEIPIEEIALVQKRLMRKANLRGKPVITATQMLESMTFNRRPSRAEATDVANAILDGTDCVMLSGESAMGKYPVESVLMLVKIAAAIESQRPAHTVREELANRRDRGGHLLPRELLALTVATAVETVSPAAVIIPTRSGASARTITRFRFPMWITAVSTQAITCQQLQFSYGVFPLHEPDHPEDWNSFARNWLEANGIEGSLVVLTEGPSSKHPEANHRMEIIDISRH